MASGAVVADTTPPAEQTLAPSTAVLVPALCATRVVAGHHHEIDGVDPVRITPTDGVAAYYALSGTQLTRDVAPGQPITLDDVRGVDLEVLELNQAAPRG